MCAVTAHAIVNYLAEHGLLELAPTAFIKLSFDFASFAYLQKAWAVCNESTVILCPDWKNYSAFSCSPLFPANIQYIQYICSTVNMQMHFAAEVAHSLQLLLNP